MAFNASASALTNPLLASPTASVYTLTTAWVFTYVALAVVSVARRGSDNFLAARYVFAGASRAF